MTEQLTEDLVAAPALDVDDVDPDSLVGEETEQEHDLDLESFAEEEDES